MTIKQCPEAPKRGSLTAGGLVEVHVDALQLQVAVAMVRARGVHAVLVADDCRGGECIGAASGARTGREAGGQVKQASTVFPALLQLAALCVLTLPELGTDLVAALAALDVDDLTHLDDFLVLCR